MTERKRANGFALMDSAFAADPKFLKLYRLAPTPTDYAAAVGVFWLILADCRRAKEAAVNWEDYPEYQEQVALLKESRLFTDSGFSDRSFTKYAPAYRSRSERTVSYPSVPDGSEGTESTDTSVQFSSVLPTHLPTNGSTTPSSQSFIRMPSQEDKSHHGQHGQTCGVCFPPVQVKA
jgi:hypothetical protein